MFFLSEELGEFLEDSLVEGGCGEERSLVVEHELFLCSSFPSWFGNSILWYTAAVPSPAGEMLGDKRGEDRSEEKRDVRRGEKWGDNIAS